MTIQEPILGDEDDRILADWASEVAMKAYRKVPSNWRRLLPEFDVVPTTLPLRDIDGITEGVEELGICEQDLSGVLVCRLTLKDGTFRVYVGGDVYSGQDDELEGSFLRELAYIMWDHCSRLRAAVSSIARHPEVGISEEDCKFGFAEALPSYVLAPRTLRQREEHLFILMDSLDKRIREGKIFRESLAAVTTA